MADNFKGLDENTLKSAEGIKSSMKDISLAARDLNKELVKTRSYLASYETQFNDISKSASKVTDLQKKAQSTSKATVDAVKEQNKQLNITKTLNIQIDNLYKAAAISTGTTKYNLEKQALTLAAARDNAQQLAADFSSIANDSAKLDKSTRFFTLLSDVVKDIPGLRQFSAPFEKASEAARKQVISNAKNKDIVEKISKLTKYNLETGSGLTKQRLKQLGLTDITGDLKGKEAAAALREAKETYKVQNATMVGAKTLGGSLGSFLKGPIWITALIEAAKFFVEAMFAADKQVTDIAKNFVISKDAARDVRNRFFELSDKAKIYAGTLNNQILLQKELVEANIQLNNLLGTAIDYSSQLGERGKYVVSQFAAISKFLKLSEEEQKGLLDLQQTSSESINDIKDSVLGTTSIYKIQTGVLINERKVLEGVLKASNAIKLTTKGGTEGLTKAVIEAQKLGLSLQKVSDISRGLLDFEQSISSELEAELLTGRNLNLETARLAALNGDLATVAAEVTKQIGSSANFSRMNVIQQEALAKSVNMTREELADTLVTQERLNTLRGKFNTLGKDQLEQLKKSGKVDENILGRISNGKGTVVDYYNALKEAGKSNKEISKLLSDQAYASIASQSAQEKFNESLEKAKETFTRFVDGGSLDKLVDFITKLVNFFGSEKTSTSTLSLSEQNAIKENKIIPAGKEFAKGGIVTSRIDNATIGEAGPEAVIPLNQLMNEFKEMRQILTAILNKEGTIMLNGTKMGTAMAVGSYKVQ